MLELVAKGVKVSVRVSDKRDVAYISTEFTNGMITYRGRWEHEKEKPNTLFQCFLYFLYMGGVDRKDQLMSYYSCERK